MPDTPVGTTSTIRGFLLTLFILGAAGTGTELLLLGHTDDAWQWVPLVLLAASLLTLAWCVVAPDGRGVGTRIEPSPRHPKRPSPFPAAASSRRP